MPTLRSVNVGMPRDVSWRGKTVHTGIWKHAVSGPRTVRHLNIDGDGQGDTAGHGGEQRAVLVYQIESYRYWQEHLGRDDFEYGQFGENFTVDGLPDDEVCIGDRYRIGEARSSRSPSRASPAIGSVCASRNRKWRRCSFPTAGLASTCVSSQKARSKRGTRSSRSRPVPRASPSPKSTHCSTSQVIHARRAGPSPAHPGPESGMEDLPLRLLDQDESDATTGNAGLVAVGPPLAWPGFRPLRATARDE